MKITKDAKYPDDFYDFSNGKNVEDEEINQWIEEVNDRLVNKPYAFAHSGNTLVIGLKDKDTNKKLFYVCNQVHELEIE